MTRKERLCVAPFRGVAGSRAKERYQGQTTFVLVSLTMSVVFLVSNFVGFAFVARQCVHVIMHRIPFQFWDKTNVKTIDSTPTLIAHKYGRNGAPPTTLDLNN